MKKAIVFAGGGSKGAYQIGAWKALNELNETFEIATGTSIGAINAGFYVQHDFDAALKMWQTLTPGDIMVNGINMEKSFETIFSQRENLIPFIKNYINYKGADVTPFHKMLSEMFHDTAFFNSSIDYALITVKFPSLEPVTVTKKDMQASQTPWQWIAASAACFPVFPLMEIDGQHYADGGYYDNIPVAAAFALGAQQVTVVDLKTDNNHEGYINHPWVKYIKPSRDLGTFMNFEKETLDTSITMGYNDTMKAYNRYFGTLYTFIPNKDSEEMYPGFGEKFVELLTQKECIFDYSSSVGKLGLQRVNKLEGATTVLANLIHKTNPTSFELFVCVLETVLKMKNTPMDEAIDFDTIIYELKTQVDGLYPLLEYDFINAFATIEKFLFRNSAKNHSEAKKWDDERWKLLITAFFRTLQHISF